MPIKKRGTIPIIDSRHLKVLAAKKNYLKDAVVVIYFDRSRNSQMDRSLLQSIVSKIDEIEPTGVYFPLFKEMNIEFYDKFEFKNKDIIVTISGEGEDSDTDGIEEDIRRAIPEAKSISFVHKSIEIRS